jgi:hypothetical protein
LKVHRRLWHSTHGLLAEESPMKFASCVALLCAVGCDSVGVRHAMGTLDLATSGAPADAGTSRPGCPGMPGCYTVYAHSDHLLYHIDLSSKQLVTVGKFNAIVNGVDEVITDLAVAPDDTIYVISKTRLYTADPSDGHVTLVGKVTNCGTFAVALSFTPDGNLYTADYNGEFCRIDLNPLTVTPVGMLTGGLAIAGDLVAVADGTLFGTAYSLTDGTTAKNNYLVTLNPSTGAVTKNIGQTGYPNLFGIAFELGQVFGFTHDGSGDVITIDPRTGVGTLYNRFKDPATNQGIPFAGAGVNAMVAPPIL